MSNATAPPLTASATIRIVTTTDTTSTTKITGLRMSVRGFSFVKLSTIAWRTIGPSNRGRARTGACVVGSVCGGAVTDMSAQAFLEVLDDRTEGQPGQERQGADDHDHAGQQAGEQAVSVRSVPAVNGTVRSLPTLAPSASAAISGTNRATSIAMPPVIV